jgi:hypothetical protein
VQILYSELHIQCYKADEIFVLSCINFNKFYFATLNGLKLFLLFHRDHTFEISGDLG